MINKRGSFTLLRNPLARPNILVKSRTKKPPRFYPRNRNLKSTSQNSKRNRFTKNRVTSILPSKSTPFEASIPPFLFSLRNEKRKKNSPALSTQVPCTCDDPSFDESAVPQQADRVESETTGRTTTTGCFARGVCVRVCVCVCVCVCMCAWMRACLSRAAFLDKVWLTAADALAAPSLFTASP